MTKTYLISFDDTDNLETIGTGHILNRFLTMVSDETSYITRHQLFVNENVPFTSHNSAMCSTINSEIDLSDLADKAAQFLETECADGSDPGLCIADVDAIEDVEALVEWGLRAKVEVLTKDAAYAVAQRCHVHLSEHGGDGQGIVGALAAVGLRLSGNDGRVRGKVMLSTARMTVAEILKATGFDRVCAYGQGPLADNCTVDLGDGQVKAVFQDYARTVLVSPAEDGCYRLVDQSHLKRY